MFAGWGMAAGSWGGLMAPPGIQAEERPCPAKRLVPGRKALMRVGEKGSHPHFSEDMSVIEEPRPRANRVARSETLRRRGGVIRLIGWRQGLV
jgi:hypothetical protein